MNTIDTRELYDEYNRLGQREADLATVTVESVLDHRQRAYLIETLPLDRAEDDRLQSLIILMEAIGEETMSDGETMIPVEDFEEYAKELAEGCGMVNDKAVWPLRHIDWSAAADELLSDYNEVTFDGEDYYVRA